MCPGHTACKRQNNFEPNIESDMQKFCSVPYSMFQILLLKCKYRISFWKAWFPVIAFVHVWGNARPVHKGIILHWSEMPRTNPLGGKMHLTSASHQHRVRKDSTIGAHFLHSFPPGWALSPHVPDPWPSRLLSQPVILNHIFFWFSDTWNTY